MPSRVHTATGCPQKPKPWSERLEIVEDQGSWRHAVSLADYILPVVANFCRLRQ